MSRVRCIAPFVSLLSSVVLVAACGGSAAEPGAQSAADASAGDATPAGQKPRGDGSLDSLEALREKLRSPLDKKELDLAAKGWGAELGRVLSAADTLSSLEKLDVSDNDLGPDGAR